MKVCTARFVCQYVTDMGDTDYGDGGQCNLEVGLRAVWNGHPDDNNYSKATPNGDMKMTITNPALKDFFKPQHTYDLVITDHADKDDAAGS